MENNAPPLPLTARTADSHTAQANQQHHRKTLPTLTQLLKNNVSAKKSTLMPNARMNNDSEGWGERQEHSGLLTPPSSQVMDATSMLISPPPEEVLRERRSHSRNNSFSRPPSVTGASKRKRDARPTMTFEASVASELSSALEHVAEVTPNPKPRKSSKHVRSQSMESPTRSTFPETSPSARMRSPTTPTKSRLGRHSTSPMKRSLLESPHITNPNADFLPPVPSHTRQHLSARRRSSTPIPPYEPPSEEFTPPREVVIDLDTLPKSAKRHVKRSAPRTKARKELKIVVVKKEPPPVDTTPMPPPSPTDDPLLLSGPAGKPKGRYRSAAERIRSGSGKSRSVADVPMEESQPSTSSHSPRFASGSPGYDAADTSMVPMSLEGRERSPVFGAQEDIDDALPQFDLNTAPDLGGGWSDSDSDNDQDAFDGEGEYTGQYTTEVVPLNQSTPNSSFEGGACSDSPFVPQTQDESMEDEDEEELALPVADGPSKQQEVEMSDGEPEDYFMGGGAALQNVTAEEHEGAAAAFAKMGSSLGRADEENGQSSDELVSTFQDELASSTDEQQELAQADGSFDEQDAHDEAGDSSMEAHDDIREMSVEEEEELEEAVIDRELSLEPPAHDVHENESSRPRRLGLPQRVEIAPSPSPPSSPPLEQERSTTPKILLNARRYGSMSPRPSVSHLIRNVFGREEEQSSYSARDATMAEADGDSSEDDSTPEDEDVVKIISGDPKAAARAAAILKMHDYDCLTAASKKKRRYTASSLDSISRDSRRKDVLGSGITKSISAARHAKKRRATLGSMVGDQVLIPGSPALSVPELLSNTSVKLDKGKAPGRFIPKYPSSLRDPFSTPTLVSRQQSESQPLLIDKSGPRAWKRDDWKLLDACFTDERLDLAAKLGLGLDTMADADQVELKNVVDRFVALMDGEDNVEAMGSSWTRECLLTRAQALPSKQRSGNVAPPTPGFLRSVHAPRDRSPTEDDVPDFTPLPRRARAMLGQKPKLPPPVADTPFSGLTAGKPHPATLMAPRYSHLLEEARAISRETPQLSASRADEPTEPATPVKDREPEPVTPPPQDESEALGSPPTIGGRMKGFFYSYLPTLSTRPKPASKVLDSRPGLPVPPPEVLSKPRGPVNTPLRPAPEKAIPHKELVDLHSVPAPPESKLPRLVKLKPKRMVELQHVSPPPEPQGIPMPQKRRSSGGSVKDLVRSFEEMEGQSASQREALKSLELRRAKSHSRLGQRMDGRPTWKP